MQALSISQSAQAITSGGLLLVPTETVYGLAADATNPTAVAKIFAAKNRPATQPLIVHVGSIEHAQALTTWPTNLPNLEVLTNSLWPGPLTLILKHKNNFAPQVTAGLPTVGIRIPNHPLLLELLNANNLAIAAPSANPHTYISPTTAQTAWNLLGSKVEGILEGGPCSCGIESTILDLSSSIPTILRPGPIPPSQIETLLGQPIQVHSAQLDPVAIAQAPGQLKKHYSPKTKLTPFPHRHIPTPVKPNEAVIFLQKPITSPSSQLKHIYWLSPNGNLATAAHNLYELLHYLDAKNLSGIHIECPPEQAGDTALGLNDRILRASHP